MTLNVTATAPGGGVPPKTPAGDMVSHCGSPVALQVYPPDPPDAVNWSEYGTPMVAAGNGEVVVITSGELIGSRKSLLALSFVWSVTVMVKVTEVEPGGGVPVRN